MIDRRRPFGRLGPLAARGRPSDPRTPRPARSTARAAFSGLPRASCSRTRAASSRSRRSRGCVANERALGRGAGLDSALRDRRLAVVQAQVGETRVLIRPVALVAVLRENRPNIAVEPNLLAGEQRGDAQARASREPETPCSLLSLLRLADGGGLARSRRPSRRASSKTCPSRSAK